jgi:hypothetical protein
MTKREALELTHQQNRLLAVGLSREDAERLRRISMTLRRWFELECGTDGGCIERDDETQKPYWLNSYTMRRSPIADRERGAYRRLAAIMKKYPNLTHYVQGDPRGCALYILTAEQLDPKYSIDSIYTRGIAIA